MKKVLSWMLFAVIMLQITMTAFAVPVGEAKVGIESRVFISGKLNENYANKNVTMLVVQDGAELASLAKEQIYHIMEMKTDETGYYELLFEADEGAYDIYLNEAKSTLEECTVSDYSESAYIEVDVDAVRGETNVNLEYRIRNIFGYDNAAYDLVTAYYNDGILVKAEVSPEDLSNSTVAVSDGKEITIPDEDEADMIKFFVWKNKSYKPAAESTVVYDRYDPDYIYTTLADQTKISLASDTKGGAYEDYIKYCGRWAKNSDGKMQGYWTRPYIEFKCDSDYLTADIAGNWDLYVNGKMVYRQYPGMSKGMQNYNFSKYLADGVSEIKIMGINESYGIIIDNITLGAGTKLYSAPEKDLNMLFIGSSSVSASYGYARLVPLALDADFTTISRSGASLGDTVGANLYPYRPAPVEGKGRYDCGLTTQFHRLETFQQVATIDEEGNVDSYLEGIGGTTPYIHHSAANYSDDNYDVIICHLAMNDEVYNEDNANTFKRNYQNFIAELRGLYPDAAIIAMKPFNGNPQNDTDKANYEYRDNVVQQMAAEGYFSGENVYYLETEDLDLDYYDNLHALESPEALDTSISGTTGHVKAADFIIKYLKDNNIVK